MFEPRGETRNASAVSRATFRGGASNHPLAADRVGSDSRRTFAEVKPVGRRRLAEDRRSATSLEHRAAEEVPVAALFAAVARRSLRSRRKVEGRAYVIDRREHAGVSRDNTGELVVVHVSRAPRIEVIDDAAIWGEHVASRAVAPVVGIVFASVLVGGVVSLLAGADSGEEFLFAESSVAVEVEEGEGDLRARRHRRGPARRDRRRTRGSRWCDCRRSPKSPRACREVRRPPGRTCAPARGRPPCRCGPRRHP